MEACREIMESAPDTRGIMLTASTEADAVIEAVAAGATGYLQKVSGMDRLLSTVKVVAAGEMRVPPGVVRRVFAKIRGGAKPEEESELTPREKVKLASFSQGMSYAAIAEARGVKPVTIRNAIYDIQVKLGVGTKQEIVVWAVRNGLLDDYARGGWQGPPSVLACRLPSHISKTVSPTIHFGPPNYTKSRTFVSKFALTL